MEAFWLCFVPLFVAVDAIGILPLYLGLTEGLAQSQRRRIIVQSVVTALCVAIGFLLAGQWLFRRLGITANDFMTAGGVLLFAIAMSDMLSADKPPARPDPESVGAVPLGVPLMVGPAVLATMLLVDQYGRMATVAATVANILIAGVLLWFSEAIVALLGRTGTRTVSKIASLILAAIAVKMVRTGVLAIVNDHLGAVKANLG